MIMIIMIKIVVIMEYHTVCMKLVINNNLHLSRMTEQRYLVTFHCTMGSCLHNTLWLAIIVTIELESCNIFSCPRVLSGHDFKQVI